MINVTNNIYSEISSSKERYEVYYPRQLAPGLVLPVVIEEAGEDGEVGEGEDDAHTPEPRLTGPALRVGGAQQPG